MAVRIRKSGRVFCAALTKEEPGDLYLHDGIAYHLSAEAKVLVSTHSEVHMATGGEWWWINNVPEGIEIDGLYTNKSIAFNKEELRLFIEATNFYKEQVGREKSEMKPEGEQHAIWDRTKFKCEELIEKTREMLKM